jgi:hypothetical protein
MVIGRCRLNESIVLIHVCAAAADGRQAARQIRDWLSVSLCTASGNSGSGKREARRRDVEDGVDDVMLQPATQLAARR